MVGCLDLNNSAVLLHSLAVYPLFLYSKFYSLVIMIPGIVLLFYLIERVMKNRTFCDNFKRLINGYFVSLLLLAFYILIFTSYILYRVLLNQPVCDSRIGSSTHKFGHFLSIFLLTLPSWFSLAFASERIMKFRRVSHYENSTFSLGFLVVWADILMIFIFYDATNADMVSFVTSPNKYNILFYGIIFSLNIATYYINLTLQKLNKYSIFNESSYYATKFATSVLNYHLAFIAALVLVITLFRCFEALIIENLVFMLAVQNIAFLIVPLYVTLMACSGCFLIFKMEKEQNEELMFSLNNEPSAIYDTNFV